LVKIERKLSTDLKNNPERLTKILRNKRRSIENMELIYRKKIIPRTKWKSIFQRTRYGILFSKKNKITSEKQIHKFIEEIIMKKSDIFFKFLGTNPYPSKIKMAMYSKKKYKSDKAKKHKIITFEI
jgi:hypothetical protein